MGTEMGGRYSTGGTEMDAQFYISRGQKGVPDFGKGTERGVR